ISTPFLYAYPFLPFTYSVWCSTDDLISYSKLLRTLLGCVPQIEINQIYTTYAQTTFNYISFIHGLILNETYLNPQNLLNYKKIWLSAHNPEKILLESAIIKVINYFLEFLSENCINLKMLEISLEMDPNNIIELSKSITSLLHQRGLKHIKFSGSIIFDKV